MNINLTLFGEMITFAILVWVTMKYIWPPITKAMQEREKKIADGLEAAERGRKSLELAEQKAKKQLKAAKDEAVGIIDVANQRVSKMLEDARDSASAEGKKMIALAKSNIVTEQENARQELRKEVAQMVVDTTRKVLEDKVDEHLNAELVDKFISGLK